MTVKIEEGKFYKTRAGEMVGPMTRLFWAATANIFAQEGVPSTRIWYEDGRCSTDPSEGDDIVEQYPMAERTPPLEPEPADIKQSLLDEACRIVNGARRTNYGTPENNFERIARFWQAYFANTGRGDIEITAADVSPLMRLMKEARLCENPDHRDSFVDIIGYSLTGAEVNQVDPGENT